MKRLCLILLLLITFSCKNNSLLKKESKVLASDAKCRVISYYPIIKLTGNAGRTDELNKILRDVNEMNRYVGNCASYFPAQNANKKKEIIGDYNVLYSSDSLLDIEFFTCWVGLSTIEYRNVFVDLKTGQLLEGNRAIPNIERGRLYPFVKKFTDSTGVSINLRAYESNSNYAIMFGRTQEDLVLYLGKEGEFGGHYKIIIPLREVTK